MRVTILPGAQGTDVMVSVSEPVADVTLPALRVRTVQYERELPHLKHVATMGLTYHLLQARRAGFDDVLFAGRDGLLREGSVWNVAFWDGERVVWPDAPVLAGITMQVLRIGLRKLGIPDEVRPLTSPAGMGAAAAVNSQWPAQPIAAIGETVFAGGDELVSRLRRAWDAVPWEPIS
ncbi:aminotransferase class IV [Winogradskya humida]|uniref:aminotransferase class IV n=1 Tax=Winogradskya humida TaxID=113566 RepID=UPI001943F299|nr:aminotransferase class IV [Actinoplanes humidus]